MANDPDYTITTLSNNLNQRNKPVFSQAANNSTALRDKCSPYTVVANPEGSENEDVKKFPFGCYSTTDILAPPIAYYTFDIDPGDGTVNDDSGNDLTGTLGCSSGSFVAIDDGTCNLPRFNDGTYTPDPLVGANCLYMSGGYGPSTNRDDPPEDRTQTWQKAPWVRFQNLITEEKWKILTGSHSVSMWVYPTFRNSYERCKTYSPPNPCPGTWCRDSLNQGSTDLFGMSIDPDLKNPSNVGWSGSFGLMIQQYHMDYFLTGPIKWAFMRPAVWPNPATVFYYSYPVFNQNCEYQTGYFTNNAWNHVMYCVSGSEGDGDRFVAVYINGNKLDAGENGQTSFPPFVTMNENYDLSFSVTASQKTTAPQEHIYLGDTNPVSTYDIHYTGSIDQVAVWDRYMTAGQVTQVYESRGKLFNVVVGQSSSINDC